MCVRPFGVKRLRVQIIIFFCSTLRNLALHKPEHICSTKKNEHISSPHDEASHRKRFTSTHGKTNDYINPTS